MLEKFESMLVHWWIFLFILFVLAFGIWYLDHRVKAIEEWVNCQPRGFVYQHCEILQP